MNNILEQMKTEATKLLSSGEVKQVIAWKKGDFPCYPEPAFFTGVKDLENMVYDKFCSMNLSKYAIEASKQPERTLIFLRPCDSFGFNQLLNENQVSREKFYVIGVSCEGSVAVNEGEETGLLESCLSCTKTTHAVLDELIEFEFDKTDALPRFAEVERLEGLTELERYEFWQAELSKCIRCNACRNVCPTCHCKKCVFDNTTYDTAQRANVTTFEEKMFHIVRAYHVAGRCTDCGQCSRVCPQDIPLHLLNRKFIKDINEFYGENPNALTTFNIDGDVEPRNGGIS